MIVIYIYGGKRMLKPNTMITICYDVKNSRQYMANVTTKKIYLHPLSFGKGEANRFNWIGYGIAIFVMPWIAGWLESQLGAQALSRDFRVLLVIAGIVVGTLSGFLSWKRRYNLQLGEYLLQYPQAEEVTDVNEALEKAGFKAFLTIVALLVTFAVSMFQFINFLDSANFSAYTRAVLFSILFAMVVVVTKDAIFITRLIASYREDANDKSEIESKDENE